jgi:excisionase family DNA binding protein
MIAGDEILQAILSAPPQRRKEALRVLRGEEVEAPAPLQPHEPYLTLAETAKRLGISAATLWRWQIPGHTLGGRPRFKLSEVEAYLQSDEFKRRAAALRAMRRGRKAKETAAPGNTDAVSPVRPKGRRTSAS